MLHRAINDNKLWLLEPFTKAQAWIDLFMNANWKDKTMSIRGNIIEVKRGQLGWSELTLAKRWRWSRDKVRRFLSYLEKEGNIRQQKTHLTSIITICNYELYQSDNEKTIQQIRQQTIQQKDNRKTTDDTRLKNVKNVKKESSPTERQFETFWDTFNDKRGKAPALKVWNTIKPDKDLFEIIIDGARRYAEKREQIIKKGSTPKMAQGWLSDKRWEDEESKPVQISRRKELTPLDIAAAEFLR